MLLHAQSTIAVSDTEAPNCQPYARALIAAFTSKACAVLAPGSLPLAVGKQTATTVLYNTVACWLTTAAASRSRDGR